MVSLDSDYDEALDVIHTIEPIVVNKWKVTDISKNKEWFLQAVTTVNYSQLGPPENDTIAVTKV